MKPHSFLFLLATSVAPALAEGPSGFQPTLSLPALPYRDSAKQQPALPPSPAVVFAVPHVKTDPRTTAESRFKMPIVAPGTDVDYKLTIVAADPKVDPKFVVPVDREPRLTVRRR